MERPNTISGLVAKREELIKLRKRLSAEIEAITVDIDHLEAAIRIFDPDNTPEARRRYAAMHRAPKGQSMRFVLSTLREATEPVTSRQMANLWCTDRGLVAKEATLSMLRKRLGATLKGLHAKGLVRRDGFVDGLIGWRIA